MQKGLLKPCQVIFFLKGEKKNANQQYVSM